MAFKISKNYNLTILLKNTLHYLTSLLHEIKQDIHAPGKCYRWMTIGEMHNVSLMFSFLFFQFCNVTFALLGELLV